jgi:hypothetical protein
MDQPNSSPQLSPPMPNPGWGYAVAALFFFAPLAIPAFIHASRVRTTCGYGDIAGSVRNFV